MLPVPFDSTDERGHRGQLARAVNQLQHPRPAFMVYVSTPTANNVTGDSTAYDVVFNVVAFDNHNNYSAGVFTAKETGKYLFSLHVTVQNLGAAHTAMQVWLAHSSGATYIVGYGGSYNGSDGSGYISRGGSIIIPLSVGDTINARVAVYGSTKTVGVYGVASCITSFSGTRVD